MDDERVVEKIVTQFLLNTCRLRPQKTKPAVQAAVQCAHAANKQPDVDAEAHYIPLTTGSVAEFYIDPMLPLVSDIDVMFHDNIILAIPQGQSPPTQLPAEFHNYVKVFEIIDSHLPGYVYLHLRYLLRERSDNSKYTCYTVECDGGMYLAATRNTVNQRQPPFHGPAVSIIQPGKQLPVDEVRCVRCLSWPSQAVNWPTRYRNYEWPASATVDSVVRNGCDVVFVAHSQCRQDKWMGQCQHRLSFSRAEIVLLNSWMPVQQLVYHMLRVFMKTERLTDSADDSEASKVSNYHIKTLMLWACELKPQSWWSDDLSLVRICVELMLNFAVWLTEAKFPHYFINDCNLMDNLFNLKVIGYGLTSISKSYLSSWFVNNYIRKCSELFPRNVSRLFDDVSTIKKLQNAVSAIVDWRKYIMPQDLRHVFNYAQLRIEGNVFHDSLTVRSLNVWLTELAKMNLSLSVYFTSVAFLHIARKISKDCFGEELTDVLAVITGLYIDAGYYSIRRSSELLLSQAGKCMKVAANKSQTDLPLIEAELYKGYLNRALRCKDSDGDSIYCLANVYLAVLYYTTGQYQTAIGHCTLVTRSQDHSQCSSHVVQGELLPKIDDDIDVVLGLAVFYQHVRTAALNLHQQTQHVTVFTTELFAHYLHVKCLSVINCQQLSDTAQSQSSTYQVQTCVKHINGMHQLNTADVLLWKSTNSFSAHVLFGNQEFRRCPDELNTSQLVELLLQSAVEHLTTFRQLEVQDFGSVFKTVTTDFEAMYAYKHGDYQRCLQLSTQNVHSLLYADPGTNVPIFPEFIQLLDDDIVSVIALTQIVNPKFRHLVTQLTLSLYLMARSQLKLRHSVTSLAQTLDYIKIALRRCPLNRTLDQLILKLTERCVLCHFRVSL